MFKKFLKIFSYIKPYSFKVILVLFYNILGTLFSISVLGLVIPFLQILFNKTPSIETPPGAINDISSLLDYFSYILSDIIRQEGEIQATMFLCVVIIITSLFRNLFTYLGHYSMAPIRNGIIRDLRNEMYHKIIDLPLSYFTNKRKGDLITRMTSDLQEIEWSITASLVIVIRDPIKIFFFLGALVYTSPQLSLFVFVLLPLSGIIIGWIGRKLKKFAHSGQAKMGMIISTIEETLTGMRIIKAFNAEKKSELKFKKINNDYVKLINRVLRRKDLGSPTSEFLSTVVMVFIIIFGTQLIFSGNSSLKPETFIGFIVFFSQIISPAKSFSSAFYNIRRGAASIDRINEVLSTKSNIVEKKDAKKATDFHDSIRFNDVYFKYDVPYVLRKINLTISKGKTIALVGESGSGKSTLVDLIPRFYDVVKGELLVDGYNVKDLQIKSLRHLFGVVNQEPILFNDTVFNNIAFGVEENVEYEEVVEAAKIANAHGFIMETSEQYDTIIGDRGSKLSGGQRQRLSIARAILKNPPVLILDEATSALDTESEKLVQEALNRLMTNRTSIVIAHRLSTIVNADEIIVLNEGEIVERGKHQELLAKQGQYKRFYELQKK